MFDRSVAEVENLFEGGLKAALVKSYPHTDPAT
jgi:hypothetical protein